MKLTRIGSLATICAVVFFDTALAGPAASAPGPIAGVGLPALALIGGAYWVGRKIFSRKR